jgi:membrane-bound lytic murein transglycosylase D
MILMLLALAASALGQVMPDRAVPLQSSVSVQPSPLRSSIVTLSVPARTERSRRAPLPPPIPIPINDHVRAALDVLLTDRSPSVAAAFRRAWAYGDRLRDVVRLTGVPEDILGLAFLESGMNPHVTSPSQAAGLWQFVATTARAYGMHITSWVDERRDPEKSTRVAARYLHDLHAQFHTWPLALAAYHLGETTVRRAVLDRGTTDLWRLGLSGETEQLVALDFAMMLIGRDPERYGFRSPSGTPAAPALIEVPGRMPLPLLARALETDPDALRDLNPELLRGVTPPAARYPLRVPAKDPGRR